MPLDESSVDAYMQRLWLVALAELRKVERDSRSTEPLDLRRLNELAAFADRCRRHSSEGVTGPAAPETRRRGLRLIAHDKRHRCADP